MISTSEGRDRVSVLVVDDSALMRRLITDVISEHPPFHVIGTARNGREALRKVHRLDPDIVTMDVEMPEIDGLQALGYIMSEAPRPVVMLSAHTREGGEMTLRALEYGAVDFVAKPSGTVSRDMVKVAGRLIEALRAARQADLRNLPVRMRRPVAAPSETVVSIGGPARACVVIAASTGGPRALLEMLSTLRPPLAAAVLLVQHMPCAFTRSLAARLDQSAPLIVTEAMDGEALHADHAYLAPGGSHMTVEGKPAGATLRLDRDAQVWGVRPAADPLFRSAAQVFRDRTVSVVLTGMGRDGAEGTAAVAAAGGRAFAQDAASAVIASMPAAAVVRGADEVPLHRMAEEVTRALQGFTAGTVEGDP